MLRIKLEDIKRQSASDNEADAWFNKEAIYAPIF